MPSDLNDFNGEPPTKKHCSSTVSDLDRCVYADDSEFAQYIDTSSFDFTGDSAEILSQSLGTDKAEANESNSTNIRTSQDLSSVEELENSEQATTQSPQALSDKELHEHTPDK
ncbi:hypothetical protein K7432_012987, partial [Basidiobolus ranarum]